jgi:proteasome lid subunit RPN8/RPN11
MKLKGDRRRDVIRIPRSIREAMIAHALEGLPFEVCGILGGTGSVVSSIHPTRNLKESSTHFLMDPREQIAAMESLRLQGLEVLAFYHSHPAGPAYPSIEDVRLALYPDVVTVIVSLESRKNPVVEAFRIIQDRITGEPVEVTFE